MKTLILTIFDLLSQIPELRYIDLDYGQLQEEKPPLAYPAALVKVNIPSTQTIDNLFQIANAEISITLVFKRNGETNSLAPDKVREEALKYLELNESLHRLFQGFQTAELEAFTRLSVSDPLIRKGLKTTVHRYSVSWQEDIATP